MPCTVLAQADASGTHLVHHLGAPSVGGDRADPDLGASRLAPPGEPGDCTGLLTTADHGGDATASRAGTSHLRVAREGGTR